MVGQSKARMPVDDIQMFYMQRSAANISLGEAAFRQTPSLMMAGVFVACNRPALITT